MSELAIDGPILSIRNVKKHFGGVHALDGVDLDILPNRIFGLIGPNGSGKTTMLNVLTGVLSPTAGELTVAGTNVTGFPSHRDAAQGLSRTFQNIRLFHKMSVFDNVKVGAHLRANYGLGAAILQTHRKREASVQRRADEALAFVGLGHRRNAMASTLPYGEQRLVEIARAMASKPRIVLLDEPLVGMPPNEIERVVEIFRSIIRAGTTILLVEHTMRVMMRICDEMAVLNFGRRIAQGTPDEIRSNDDVITAYLGRGH